MHYEFRAYSRSSHQTLRMEPDWMSVLHLGRTADEEIPSYFQQSRFEQLQNRACRSAVNDGLLDAVCAKTAECPSERFLHCRQWQTVPVFPASHQ